MYMYIFGIRCILKFYEYRHQKKQIDLSLSFRLTGLSSGAKLELVQLSRSPSVVSVALQLPEQEAHGAPSGRLIDKFPSNTTLWLVLRKFEAGVAGNGTTRNLTARGAPSTSAGSGRLFYQTPVVQVMNRELSSFTDLQKTLGQLGFNNGSALIRLSFRITEKPLEQAMVDIEGYFKSIQETEGPITGSLQESTSTATEQEISKSQESKDTPESTSLSTPSTTEPTTTSSSDKPDLSTNTAPAQSQTQPQSTLVSSRPTVVYAPPSSAVPQSAQTPFNEVDYVPTVDHAKSHQNRLNVSSRPTRLPTDAEIAAQESAVKDKLASITEIEVKIRFPDQSQVVSKFGQNDSGQSLYGFVQGCLDQQFANEKFFLSSPASGAPSSSSSSSSNQNKTIIPDTAEKSLIRDLRLSGRVLVNFSWDQSASMNARNAGGQLLRPDLRVTASQIKVQDVAAISAEDESENRSFMERMRQSTNSSGDQNRSGGKKGGIPKWLKLPGKK